MPNVAQVLKAEIERIAKKALRAETTSLKKASVTYRTEIAALKRRAHELEQAIRALGKHARKTTPAAAPTDDSRKTRFSAKSLASQRRRLGLSAEDVGRLIGASGQSVYNWEAGKARPRDSHLAAIAALKTLGRRTAVAHLATMDSAQ
ncbi:MAG TPA: helix-turn-helix transcriptional regulator [Polyangia bacterium]